MAVKAIPEGYHSYTPYYVVDGASEFIEFLKKAFGAKELMRMPGPGGKIAHAEVRIGDSAVMLADGGAEHPPRPHYGMLYVTDVDTVFKTAVSAGAKAVRQPENQFYGDRMGAVKDKWGNDWSIGTHVEDVSQDEMKKRMEKMKPGQAS
jgi:PhnB protein